MAERTIKRRMMLTRSRAGCLTCKIRRVKCDEAKPICQRCAKANRECAGYSSGESNDTKSKPLSITYYTPNVFRGMRLREGKKVGLDSMQDQGALDWFFQWCVKCFSPDSMLHHIYQEKIHEPAIRHAMATMGLLFEIYTHDIKGSARIERSMTAMQHYDRAIRSLLKQAERNAWKENLSTLILACFLFVCIENAQGNYHLALSHLQSGFKVYQEGKKKMRQMADQVGVTREETRFHSLFGRLLCQLTNFDVADCARFFRIMDWSTGEESQEFPDIDSARWSLLAIVERLIHIRNMWASRNTFSGLLRKAESVYPSAETILDHLAREMLTLDQWILSLNIYLSHGISRSEICEAYVLALCGFFLKFRITMDQAAMNHRDCPRFDFSHIARLGDTLLHEYSISSTGASSDMKRAVHQIRQEADGSTHALFTGDNCSKPLLDNRWSERKSSDQHKLFLYLSVFCSLCVASVHSPDPQIRHKAHEIVESVCNCENGWDMTLTNHIAHLFGPAASASDYETTKIPLDKDVSYKFGELTSPEIHVLLDQLQLLK